jgi:hypothetical protein
MMQFKARAPFTRFTKNRAAGAVETMEPPVPQFPQRDDCYEIKQKRTDELRNYLQRHGRLITMNKEHRLISDVDRYIVHFNTAVTKGIIS